MTSGLCARLAATRLSCRAVALRAGGLLSALARLSLVSCTLTMLPGCLVDDPPPYAQPKRTAPRLDYHRAEPLLDQLIVASPPDLLRFKIPVVSEDAGEGLTAQFFFDATLVNYQSLQASTLDDNERAAEFAFSVLRSISSGCHRFKIRVAHSSNLPSGDGPALDPSDLAEVYWWSNLNLPADQSGGMLKDCPYLTWEQNP